VPDGPPVPPCDNDGDGDGFGSGCQLGPDCDDDDVEVHTLLTFFPDADGDGALSDKPVEACTDGTLPRGAAFELVTADVDCDDDTPARAPGLPEECDGVDNDCSGLADDGDTCPCEPLYDDSGKVYLRCGPGVWADACQGLPGYRLVIVDDQAEQDFLDAAGGRFWIGLSDLAQEGEYAWVDGAPMSLDLFAPNQPDNFNGEEHCIDSGGLTWNDLPCDQLRDAMCESVPLPVGGCVDADGDLRGEGCRLGPDCDDGDADAWAVLAGWRDEDGDGATVEAGEPVCVGDDFPAGFAPAPGAVDCDDRDIDRQDDCNCEVRYRGEDSYLFCDDERTWTEARDRCRDRGRELVTVDDVDENSFLALEGALIGFNNWWIGLNDRQNEDDFEWVEDDSNMSLDLFASGEPNNSNGEDCVELAGVRWNDAECFSDRRYICE
jgi:hypothetical protein